MASEYPFHPGIEAVAEGEAAEGRVQWRLDEQQALRRAPVQNRVQLVNTYWMVTRPGKRAHSELENPPFLRGKSTN